MSKKAPHTPVLVIIDQGRARGTGEELRNVHFVDSHEGARQTMLSAVDLPKHLADMAEAYFTSFGVKVEHEPAEAKGQP